MRLLLVEDNQRLSSSIRLSLESDGYAVDSAATGIEGEDMALAAPFDAIILDILLPEKNGLDVCRSLRKQGLRTPILMLTAMDTVDDRVVGLDNGADDYLVKPFAMAELRARLRALLRRDAPEKTGPLVIADLELDPASHKISRAGISIDLTTKEFALLEYFMRNPNRLITREMAQEHVWNFDSITGSNVLDVYIRRLRRKIDDPHSVKLFETIRGAGYKLIKPGGK